MIINGLDMDKLGIGDVKRETLVGGVVFGEMFSEHIKQILGCITFGPVVIVDEFEGLGEKDDSGDDFEWEYAE